MNPPATEVRPDPAGDRAGFDAALQALAREATGVSEPAAASDAGRAGAGGAEGVVPVVGRPAPAPSGGAAPAAAAVAPAVDLSPVLAELRRLAETETANRQLFDALHAELRQYRDGFLLEGLHLPTIRDLMSLLDDLESVRCQVATLVSGRAPGSGRARGEVARGLERAEQNLDNSVHFVREILHRLDVEEIGAGEGAFNRALHRQVGVEAAVEPAQEGRIASVVRCGFSWRGRTLRPAEVIVCRSASPGTG